MENNLNLDTTHSGSDTSGLSHSQNSCIPVIRTQGLTKRYGMVNAVDHVDMTVYKGDIYGFIGSNGAGKTTFMRLIIGLIAPTNGTIELFGKGDRSSLTKLRAKIGCIVETPSLMLNMTAYDCLNTQRLLLGIKDDSVIHSLLELVDLAGTDKKLVRNFSLGMKQRLSIAQALLNDPEILMLDEPTNGMDPQGIVEIRHLLARLRQERGITILISSHILTELQQLATRFGIIREGKLIDEFSYEDFAHSSNLHITIQVSNLQSAVKILSGHLPQNSYEIDPMTGYIKLIDQYFSTVNRKLIENGIDVSIISKGQYSLEEYFLDKVGRTNA